MTEQEQFAAYLARLPVLDLTWPAEVRAGWFGCWQVLFRWSCRLVVLEAIDRYVAETSPTAPEPTISAARRSEGQRRRWEAWRQLHGR